MAGFELLCLSQPLFLATPFEVKLISRSSQCGIYCIFISVLLRYSHFAHGVFIVAYFSRGWGRCSFAYTQSGLLLLTCYLSFSPTAWKIMGSRASSLAKASGNRLRHALHTHPLYLHSPLQWDSFSLSFPRPLLHYVKALCVLSHLFCNSRAVSLKGLKVLSTISNFVEQLQRGAHSLVCMQKTCYYPLVTV